MGGGRPRDGGQARRGARHRGAGAPAGDRGVASARRASKGAAVPDCTRVAPPRVRSRQQRAVERPVRRGSRPRQPAGGARRPPRAPHTRGARRRREIVVGAVPRGARPLEHPAARGRARGRRRPAHPAGARAAGTVRARAPPLAGAAPGDAGWPRRSGGGACAGRPVGGRQAGRPRTACRRRATPAREPRCDVPARRSGGLGLGGRRARLASAGKGTRGTGRQFV